MQKMNVVANTRGTAPNLAGIDLNLLVALEALLAEQSVSRAAGRIGVSQPAASHALRRLRDLLDDPLLVRSGTSMQRTPLAVELQPLLAEALERVRAVFNSGAFDPATSRRTLRLMLPDHVGDLLLGRLADLLQQRAPNMRAELVPWQSADHDLGRNVDAVVTCHPESFTGFYRQRLFGDRDVVAVGRGHPFVQQSGPLGLTAFLEARHVAVVEHGHGEDPVDAWLRELGHERRLGAVVTGYVQALLLVARAGFVAVLPSSLVRSNRQLLQLTALESPLDAGIFEEFLLHPVRLHGDPASIWLRELFREIGREIDREDGRAGAAAPNLAGTAGDSSVGKETGVGVSGTPYISARTPLANGT